MKEENVYTAYQVAAYLVMLSYHKDFKTMVSVEQAELVSAFLAESERGRKLLKRSQSAWVRAIYRRSIELFVPGFGAHLVTRKQYIEEKILAYIKQYPDAQIINIGSGLDPLLSKLANRGIQNRLIEIDYPVITRKKSKVCRQRNITFIGADLSQTSIRAVLKGSGFQPALPVFYIAEGVLMYVPEASAFQLLETLPTLNTSSAQCIFSAMQPMDQKRIVSRPLEKLMQRKNTAYYWSKTMKQLGQQLTGVGFSVLEQKDHEQMHKSHGHQQKKPDHFFVGEYYNWVEKVVE